MSDVLVLGASHSGIAIAAALRSAGYDGSVSVLTKEVGMPYHRPPLSKEGLSTTDYSPSLLRPENFYKTSRITLEQGAMVTELNLKDRYVLAADGRRYHYAKLILACGAEPRRLSADVDPQGVALYLRTFEDFLHLKSRLSGVQSIAIVGGGLIGLEVASMAVARGLRTTLFEASDRLMKRAVSRSISGYLLGRHQASGLDARLDISIISIIRDDQRGKDVISLNDGERLQADLTVAAIGVVPNDSLARQAGLRVDNGVLVSELGEASDPAVYAIGDCAAWFNPDLGRHVRSEAVNPGQDQAKAVASRIAGASLPPRRIPRYWSHQAAIQLQMAGDVHAAATEVVLNAPESGAFSVLGIKDDQLISVQSVNAPQQFTKLFNLIGVGRDGLVMALDVEFPPPHH